MMIPRTNPAASQVACYYTHVAFIKKIEQNMSILQLTNPTLLLDWTGTTEFLVMMNNNIAVKNLAVSMFIRKKCKSIRKTL